MPEGKPIKENIEISTSGIRCVRQKGDMIVIRYEDGRKIAVTFTSTRKANKEWRDSSFFDADIPNILFFGVLRVEES